MNSNRGTSSPVISGSDIDHDSSSPQNQQPHTNANIVAIHKTPPRSRHSSGNNNNNTVTNGTHNHGNTNNFGNPNNYHLSPSFTNKSSTTASVGATSANTGVSADPQELTLFVQDLLEQMQTKFSTMGDSIIGRIDEMGSRIDELEKSISELMEQAGMDHPSSNGLIMTPSRSRKASNPGSADHSANSGGLNVGFPDN